MGIWTLLKFNFKYYRRHAVLSLLCVLGICLGVGIIVAVELINKLRADFVFFVRGLPFRAGNPFHRLSLWQNR